VRVQYYMMPVQMNDYCGRIALGYTMYYADQYMLNAQFDKNIKQQYKAKLDNKSKQQ